MTRPVARRAQNSTEIPEISPQPQPPPHVSAATFRTLLRSNTAASPRSRAAARQANNSTSWVALVLVVLAAAGGVGWGMRDSDNAPRAASEGAQPRPVMGTSQLGNSGQVAGPVGSSSAATNGAIFGATGAPAVVGSAPVGMPSPAVGSAAEGGQITAASRNENGGVLAYLTGEVEGRVPTPEVTASVPTTEASSPALVPTTEPIAPPPTTTSDTSSEPTNGPKRTPRSPRPKGRD